MRPFVLPASLCFVIAGSLSLVTPSAAQGDLSEPAMRGELAAFALSDFFPNTRYVAYIGGSFRIFYVGAGPEDPPQSEGGYAEIAGRACESQRGELQTLAGAVDSPPGAGYQAADFLRARLGYSVKDIAEKLTVGCILPLNSPISAEEVCVSPLYGNGWQC